MSRPALTRRANQASVGGVSAASTTFYEFFAGGGMARLGLGEAWSCGTMVATTLA